MRKRAMSVLLAAAMITGTMTGTAVMVKADDEPVTLTVLAGQSTTDAGIEDMIDEALAEKYPNITLEWECVDWGNDFQPKMQQYMQSGLPDIMIGKAQDVSTYAPQGVLGEIDSTYLDRGLDAARENVTIDGKTYGLVYNAMYQGVYYNKAMFKENGWEIPKTLDDLQAIIDAVENGTITNTELVGVISNNKNAYALTRAGNHQIPAQCVSPKDFETREEFNKVFLEKVDELKPDLIVLAGFLVVIPEEMISRYRNKIINIHPSLIPSFCGTGYYGLKVHEAALARGVKVVGATVHFVDEGTDTGPIILQKAVEVEEGDTPEVLQRRVMEQAEWKILPHAIDLIANGKVTVKDGRVSIAR